ncbi:uncharacterized protein MONBRDRAFT_33112 [Monosiga brevicollis MX1]|uniref:Uncharacterized protein n=1 Tax=Monosiga brevicollis TaxID=81824 RepID=A9V3S5_MONBE|nr:uncharacterized protein MONBRDRAFT_33112 [Monosiga brevicollis MX1]EDQ87757.1 predicted protein [Monosiga brevicollis MX1]|eukprot:XP_001747290.1 hypothetical protein [Monosiga brevicollis MX1]
MPVSGAFFVATLAVLAAAVAGVRLTPESQLIGVMACGNATNSSDDTISAYPPGQCLPLEAGQMYLRSSVDNQIISRRFTTGVNCSGNLTLFFHIMGSLKFVDTNYTTGQCSAGVQLDVLTGAPAHTVAYGIYYATTACDANYTFGYQFLQNICRPWGHRFWTYEYDRGKGIRQLWGFKTADCSDLEHAVAVQTWWPYTCYVHKTPSYLITRQFFVGIPSMANSN